MILPYGALRVTTSTPLAQHLPCKQQGRKQLGITAAMGSRQITSRDHVPPAVTARVRPGPLCKLLHNPRTAAAMESAPPVCVAMPSILASVRLAVWSSPRNGGIALAHAPEESMRTRQREPRPSGRVSRSLRLSSGAGVRAPAQTPRVHAGKVPPEACKRSRMDAAIAFACSWATRLAACARCCAIAWWWAPEAMASSRLRRNWRICPRESGVGSGSSRNHACSSACRALTRSWGLQVSVASSKAKPASERAVVLCVVGVGALGVSESRPAVSERGGVTRGSGHGVGDGASTLHSAGARKRRAQAPRALTRAGATGGS